MIVPVDSKGARRRGVLLFSIGAAGAVVLGALGGERETPQLGSLYCRPEVRFRIRQYPGTQKSTARLEASCLVLLRPSLAAPCAGAEQIQARASGRQY